MLCSTYSVTCAFVGALVWAFSEPLYPVTSLGNKFWLDIKFRFVITVHFQRPRGVPQMHMKNTHNVTPDSPAGWLEEAEVHWIWPS